MNRKRACPNTTTGGPVAAGTLVPLPMVAARQYAFDTEPRPKEAVCRTLTNLLRHATRAGNLRQDSIRLRFHASATTPTLDRIGHGSRRSPPWPRFRERRWLASKEALGARRLRVGWAAACGKAHVRCDATG